MSAREVFEADEWELNALLLEREREHRDRETERALRQRRGS